VISTDMGLRRVSASLRPVSDQYQCSSVDVICNAIRCRVSAIQSGLVGFECEPRPRGTDSSAPIRARGWLPGLPLAAGDHAARAVPQRCGCQGLQSVLSGSCMHVVCCQRGFLLSLCWPPRRLGNGIAAIAWSSLAGSLYSPAAHGNHSAAFFNLLDEVTAVCCHGPRDTAGGAGRGGLCDHPPRHLLRSCRNARPLWRAGPMHSLALALRRRACGWARRREALTRRLGRTRSLWQRGPRWRGLANRLEQVLFTWSSV
jgi:hypothetical protein